MDNHTSLNADLRVRAVARSGYMDGQPNPSPTVWRKRLYLDGPVEAGIVTSAVRYDPGAESPHHTHPGGEEVFVLEGGFEDEFGAYPART